jgi:hypothetical protein
MPDGSPRRTVTDSKLMIVCAASAAGTGAETDARLQTQKLESLALPVNRLFTSNRIDFRSSRSHGLANGRRRRCTLARGWRLG